MKLMSTLSLGAAAAALLAAAVASPADAQRRNRNSEQAEPAAQPGQWTPTLSREFRAAAAPADEAATQQNWAAAQQALATAAPLAGTPDERYTLASIRLKVAQGQNDPAQQRAALEEMIASGIDPYGRVPEYRFYVGNLAYQANDLPTAIRELTAAEEAGYQNANLNLTLAEAYWKSNQPDQGFARVERAIEQERAAGRTPPASWYRRAASVAYQARNMEQVNKWTQAQLEAEPTAENWRTVLAIYEEANEFDDQMQLDLNRLRLSTGALTSERDFFNYAQLASDRGLFGETKRVIEAGEASGDIQRAGPIGQLYTQANGRIAADRREVDASFGRLAAASGADALDTANTLLAYGEDARAAEAYRAAIQKGGIDANLANTRLGIALARQGQGEAAQQAFSQVQGARAPLARYWALYATMPRS